MSYSDSLIKNISLLEADIQKKYGLDSDVWLTVDPLIHGLLLHIQVKVAQNVTSDDLKKDIEDVLILHIGKNKFEFTSSSSSKGRGRKKKGGIDPDRSMTLNAIVSGDL